MAHNRDPDQGWKCAKERTSSSGDLNFGMWKAGTERRLIAEIDAAMTNIPMVTGYSPTRWRKASDVMLKKKGGSDLVHKLRIIILFAVDFNFLNKHIGRE